MFIFKVMLALLTPIHQKFLESIKNKNDYKDSLYYRSL
jgi:hypothetical protein